MPELRDQLADHLGSGFALERELTGGGMSTVFVAMDHQLQRRVVVKVLPAELAAAVSLDRFKQEILLSAALQHPHIVPVLSTGEVAGLPYFIMPFIEGESLRSRLTRGPLSVRETVAILRDVARALAYAHSRDVVHRDIKPDNILLSTGSAVVTDFGVAKALNASTRGRRRSTTPQPVVQPRPITALGLAVGTPAYMAPEQAAGDPKTDHRADIYSLGVVGYEMLTGTPPFHGTSPQQVLAAQLVHTPPAIASRRYDVPAPLVKLLDRLLSKEPARRPATAADLARSLENPDLVTGAFAIAPTRLSRRLRYLLTGMVCLAAGVFLGWMLFGR